MKPKTPDSGWPKSVRYTGYGLAATLGPYSVLWLISQSPFVLELLSDSQRDWLRRYFGVPEHDQELALLTKQKPPKLLQLPGEPSTRERLLSRNQAALEATPLTIQVTTGSLCTTITVPGHVLARTEALREYLPTDWQASDMMALDFASTSQSDIEDETIAEDSYSDAEASNSTNDPLAQQTMIYSTWHYHGNTTPAATTATTTTSPLSQQQSRHADDWQKQELAAAIAALEHELRTGSLRDMDDIQTELAAKKSQLRRLQWKRWVPW